MLSERVFLCADRRDEHSAKRPKLDSEEAQPTESDWAGPVVLTRRESEVARLTLEGLTAKEIAHELSLSPRTIEDYLHKVKIKLSCRSKSELVTKLVKFYKK